MNTETGNRLTSTGLLILRLGIGGFFLTHGWGKLQMLLDGQAEQFGRHLGLNPQISLGLMVFAEFVCSILIMLGLATRLACIPPIIGMAVAVLTVHAADPWAMNQAGSSKEPALHFLIVFLALLCTGPGCFSLDALFCRKCCKTCEPSSKTPAPPPTYG